MTGQGVWFHAVVAARGDKALRERNLSTEPPLDGGCIRAWRTDAARLFRFGDDSASQGPKRKTHRFLTLIFFCIHTLRGVGLVCAFNLAWSWRPAWLWRADSAR
jgi:hypothetical protein